MASDDHAVLVGVTRYPHLGDLKGPENDARAVRDWLEDPAGGNVPAKNITLVTSSQFTPGDPPEPTPERVLSQFATLNSRGQASAPKPVGRRLYIFLAGHGAALPSDLFEVVLLMANAKRGEMSHYVPGRMMVSHFATAAYFRQIVMFMDCCRDALPRVKWRPLPWDALGNSGDDDNDVEYCLGFATRWSRKARERTFGEEGSRGIFTRSVLEGLRAGCDTPGELEDFVLHRLPAIAGKKGFKRPEFSFSNDEMRLSDGNGVQLPRLRIVFSAPDPDVTVTVKDGNLHALDSQPMDGPPWELPLRPGLYLIERSDRADQLTINLTGDQDVEI